MDDTMNALVSKCLDQELNWLESLIDFRFKTYFEDAEDSADISIVEPPDLSKYSTNYANYISQNNLGYYERIMLIISMTPHLRPQLLDSFFIKNAALDRTYTEFGGQVSNTHSGFMPTGETLAFILSGKHIERRIQLFELFDSQHLFYRNGVLIKDENARNEPLLSQLLKISDEFLMKFTSQSAYLPEYNTTFPAKRIETRLEWDDLVLSREVITDIQDVSTWIDKADVIMHDMGMDRVLKRGYRCLFYGPSGTGKTLTATLIGKQFNMDVYRVDLSMVVSKYIGETEKNLSKVFDLAENRNWILFFDEADSLFGKRTSTNSSNDRYANQEVAYLLQRVEDFDGLVILASNLKVNIDDAFTRRFQSIIHFPIPDTEQRFQLWKNIMVKYCQVDASVDLYKIAEDYKLTGGSITNVVRYATIKMFQKSNDKIEYLDILKGIEKELKKEGKTINLSRLKS